MSASTVSPCFNDQLTDLGTSQRYLPAQVFVLSLRTVSFTFLNHLDLYIVNHRMGGNCTRNPICIYLSMFGDHNSALTAKVPAATIKAHGARMFPVPAEKGASWRFGACFRHGRDSYSHILT